MDKIRLLLVDDHKIVLAGLRMLFQAEADMEIVGEVGSGTIGLGSHGRIETGRGDYGCGHAGYERY
jgi:DNA-binding NarL/FixJ family response regulator